MNQPDTSAVTQFRDGDILVAAIDNPPVNALSHAVRAGLCKALDLLETDPGLHGMIISARGKMFSAGADVTEFGKPMQSPLLGDLIARLHACEKPVVAALDGATLGGGLEVALACNHRIASVKASLGFPEVKLGTLPGAGGSIGLPRLVGIDHALRMISSGKPVKADEALTIGLVDRIAGDDLLAAAADMARAAAKAPPRRISTMPFPPFDKDKQDEARAGLARKFPGLEAPQRIVDLFAMAADTPYADAAEQEYALCKELLGSAQSRALRHVFAAERRAARLPEAMGQADARAIDSVAVLGSGTMGTGITIACLDAGLPVTLVGRSPEILERAVTSIRKSYEKSAQRGFLTQDAADARLANLNATTELGAVSASDLVMEAIDEDLDAKRALFDNLSPLLGDDCILASNTSYLDLRQLSAATTNPGHFAGLHFFNPANRMRLVEIAFADQTEPVVLASLLAFSKRLGKTPVIVGPSEGFIANRMLAKRTREALFLLEEGATPAQIDRVLTEFGFPVGPFTLADMAGLDVMAATRATRAATMSARERNADIAEQLVASGRTGRKSGAGYYAYGDDGTPSEDPLLDTLLASHREKRGIAPRAVSDDEIRERCIFALINEGALLIAEGAVARASDIDVVWTSGLAFPAHLGGPMFHAEETGLRTIHDALKRYSETRGVAELEPAALLSELASNGGSFG